MSFIVKQNTAVNVPFQLTNSGTPATGETPDVFFSPNGDSFRETEASGAVEIGLGWYYIALNASETSDLGFIVVNAGADGVLGSAVIQVVP